MEIILAKIGLILTIGAILFVSTIAKLSLFDDLKRENEVVLWEISNALALLCVIIWMTCYLISKNLFWS